MISRAVWFGAAHLGTWRTGLGYTRERHIRRSVLEAPRPARHPLLPAPPLTAERLLLRLPHAHGASELLGTWLSCGEPLWFSGRHPGVKGTPVSVRRCASPFCTCFPASPARPARRLRYRRMRCAFRLQLRHAGRLRQWRRRRQTAAEKRKAGASAAGRKRPHAGSRCGIRLITISTKGA